MATRVFTNRTEFENEVVRRARCILGLWGDPKSELIRVCINAVRNYHGLEFKDDEIAMCAVACAFDTDFYTIEYVSTEGVK